MIKDDFIEAATLVTAEKRDHMTAKYEGLRHNYNDLVDSFDQSNELRDIYKKLLVDQREEINKMKI